MKRANVVGAGLAGCEAAYQLAKRGVKVRLFGDERLFCCTKRYKIADLVSGTPFGILQILIGYSAAKAFGANPYLGAVVGGAFINSSLQSA